MQFSYEWLSELCPSGRSPEAVSEALTARGLTVDSLSALGADHVLEVDIPANRGDCLGYIGISRELSAAFDCPLALPVEPLETPSGAASPLDGFHVEIAAPDLCHRFTAGIVRGVTIGPSPDWVVRRLEASGIRSINNVVDASNLVMLAVGNPVHFYDLARLPGALLRVRSAEPGETLTTLDGVERKLDPSMLLIANDAGPLGLAGIMGGADSEIEDDTRDVLVEAAWFLPGSVRSTARALGMRTDASHRFERSVDLDSAPTAQALSARLLVDLAGGTPDPGWLDVHPTPRQATSVSLRPGQLERLLGYRPDDSEVAAALTALNLAPRTGDDGTIAVTVPSYRFDLEREADLVEEVARHLGYDRIPTVRTDMVVAPISPGLGPIEELARDTLTAAGFHEAYGYAMIGPGEDDPFVPAGTPAPLHLLNPQSEGMSVLRRSLFPSLLKALSLNLRRGARAVRLFEVEHVFLPRGDGRLPNEPTRVALAWTGQAMPEHWSAAPRDVDLFDAMGVVERLMTTIAPTLQAERRAAAPGSPVARAGLHPGKQATWALAEALGDPASDTLAWAGELHPDHAGDIDVPVYLAAVELDLLEAFAGKVPNYKPLARLGKVQRDLAVVLPADRTFAEVCEALAAVAAPAPAEFDAVDRYVGDRVPAGSAAVTVRVTLNPHDQTLTDDQIEGYRAALVAALKQRLGLEIRG